MDELDRDHQSLSIDCRRPSADDLAIAEYPDADSRLLYLLFVNLCHILRSSSLEHVEFTGTRRVHWNTSH